MSSSERVIDRVPALLDAWCERRELKPLAIMLPAWFSINGLTDGYEIYREALRHTRAMCRDVLTEEELRLIGSAIAEIDQALMNR